MADVGMKEHVQVDTEALSLSEFAGQAGRKVQLDIDDAPFLDTPEEETPPAPGDAGSSRAEAAEADVPKASRAKRFLVPGAGLVLLLLGAAVWFLFFRTPPPAETGPEPVVVVVPSPEEITGPAGFNVVFAPFMVEQRVDGEVRFLNTNFTAVTTDEAVSAEARSKILILRDAVYYYLRNKTHEYLIDPDNSLTIKQDLTDILNGYLSKGKLDDVLLENYIMK